MKDERRKITYECPDFVIATPGRLIDHMQNTKGFSLEDIEVKTLEDLLAYETGESLEAAASYIDLGHETLDRPRIHYMAGRAFFAGDSLE